VGDFDISEHIGFQKSQKAKFKNQVNYKKQHLFSNLVIGVILMKDDV
jgi:hypothetical protein